MRHRAIANTTITYWSVPDECFVTESTVFPRTAGIGDDPAESRAHFTEMLHDMLEDFERERVLGYSTPGRPAKNGLDLHVKVRESTKRLIDQYRATMGLSQGEFIDHMLAVFEIHSDLDKTKSPEKPASKTTEVWYKNRVAYRQFDNAQVGLMAEHSEEWSPIVAVHQPALSGRATDKKANIITQHFPSLAAQADRDSIWVNL